MKVLLEKLDRNGGRDKANKKSTDFEKKLSKWSLQGYVCVCEPMEKRWGRFADCAANETIRSKKTENFSPKTVNQTFWLFFAHLKILSGDDSSLVRYVGNQMAFQIVRRRKN